MKRNIRFPNLLWTTFRMGFNQLLLGFLLCGFARAHPIFGQEAMNRSVTLSVENIELKQVFRMIEKQADVKFVYSSSVIDTRQRVSLTAIDRKLDWVLNTLLKPISVSYTVSDNRILLRREREAQSAIPKSALEIDPTC